MPKNISKKGDLLKLPEVSPIYYQERAYNKDSAYEALEFFSKGRNIAQLSAAWGVSQKLIIKWGKDHPEFQAILDYGKDLKLAFWTGILDQGILGTLELSPAQAGLLKFKLEREQKDLYGTEKGGIVINNNTLNMTDKEVKDRIDYLLKKKDEGV